MSWFEFMLSPLLGSLSQKPELQVEILCEITRQTYKLLMRKFFHSCQQVRIMESLNFYFEKYF